MGISPPTTGPHLEKHFTSSVLLWVRNEQPRQTGMDYWKGPEDRRHRGSHFPIRAFAAQGAQANRPGHKDEVNVFRRTLLYAGPPNTSRWYDVASPAETVGARTVIYLRRRPGVRPGEFRRAVKKELVPALADTGMLKELRTQSFMPWIKEMWDTPRVAHDNPADQRFHASIILGFAEPAARPAFLSSPTVRNLSHQLKPVVSAIHAYDVEAALTYVKSGRILPHYKE